MNIKKEKENIKKKKKVSILFGAGAEVSLGLCNGMNFSKIVLGIDCEKLNNDVKSFYDNKIKEINDNWYPHLNKKHTFEYKKLLESSIRKQLLDSDFDFKKNYDDEVSKLKDEDPRILERIVNEHTSYMGILDEEFHTLIKPKVLGPEKFWRVVFCYARAYAYLVGQMSRSADDEVDYFKILNDFHYSKRIMNQFSENRNDIYYKVLNKYKNNVNIITTNYTNLIETIGEINPDNVAYIHGKFGWFESAKKNMVFDAWNEDLPNDIVFPFIFLQSGVKPIVSRQQIREYSKMISFLDETDCLLICGFALNYDDQHINSIIQSYLKDGKKVKYFRYLNDAKEDDHDVQVLYNKLNIENDDGNRFSVINIDGKNCISEFEKILKEELEETT